MVKDVDIEALVLKARHLECLNSQEVFPGSILGNLSPPAQEEILCRLRGLSTTLSNANEVAADDLILTTTPSLNVEGIEQQVSNVCNSIESGMILDSNINLKQAAEDGVTIAIGAKEKVNLRRYILDDIHPSDDSELPRGSIRYDLSLTTGARTRFRYGKYSGKSVIVEHYPYDSISDFSSSIITSGPTRRHLSKVVHQLKLAKPAGLRVLPCIGYLHEDHASRISLVFQIKSNIVATDPPVPLLTLYQQKKNIPLGKRAALALTLARTMQDLHLVGWVHKGWKSSNILFFKESTSSIHNSKLDASNETPPSNLASPWIFGFETSRHEEDDSSLKPDYSPATNAYRHPERWRQPELKFEKAHDVYALVSRSARICLQAMLTVRRGSSVSKSQCGGRSCILRTSTLQQSMLSMSKTV